MKSTDMTGQVVMISGATGQIGQSLVSAVLERGGQVIGFDICMNNIDQIINSQKWNQKYIHMVEVDITKRDEVNNAFVTGIKKFGKITAQINNAGISTFDSWRDRTEEEFDNVMDVNLKGTFNCMKFFMEYLIKEKNHGSIVNIASHYGLISPDPRIYTDCARRSPEVYGATKAGLIQMTKYFSVNGIADGADVRVNAIAPGGIRNPSDPQGPDFQKHYGERCPLGRLGEIEEIIGPVLFLLSNEASYINGHTLVVDGGMTAW